MKAIFSVEYVVTSNFDAIPGNCQLCASLPAVTVLVLCAFFYPESYSISSHTFILELDDDVRHNKELN